MKLSIIILAAGRGTRMKSDLPKVLHTIAGKSMLEHVIASAQALNPHEIFIVHGYQGELLAEKLSHLSLTWVAQEQQLGTGHAVLQVMPYIQDEKNHSIMVLCGDVPLISSETLNHLRHLSSENQVGLVTAHAENPQELGRIVRDEQGNFLSIVEYKDAREAERNIKEINAGLYCFPAYYLSSWLKKISPNNAQKEYYLTDVLSLALEEGLSIKTIQPACFYEVMGVNDRIQLAMMERYYQKKQAEKLMRNGVTLLDPARIDIRGELVIGQESTIDINVIFEGEVSLGKGCFIGPNCLIKNSKIGDAVKIEANSVIEGCWIESHAHIGPFARLRMGTHLKEYARIGNFVEIKNSEIGEKSKVNHLSYLGDAHLGCEVNIGAGTITCNYDGVNKHKTKIGDKAFIGSGTHLVAPIEVGEGAFIGAGSTLTDHAPSHELTLARSRQLTIKGWKSAQKLKKKEN